MQIEFNNIGGATCIIRIDSSLKIAIDPTLEPKGSKLVFKSFKSERIKGPVYTQEMFNDIDIWLLTHHHADHIDDLGLQMIDGNALVITNRDCIDLLKNRNIKVLHWNETWPTKIGDYQIKIVAIPAYHGNNIIMRNIVGKVNGYLVEVKTSDEKKVIYFTSDTVYHANIVKSINQPVDLMIANMGAVGDGKFGGPLTMSVPMLKKIEEILRPKQIYPVHIDDFSHYKTKEQDLLDEGYLVSARGKWIRVL